MTNEEGQRRSRSSRRTYSAPRLVDYGLVASITLGSQSKKDDADSTKTLIAK
jgi:hypothetical protein